IFRNDFSGNGTRNRLDWSRSEGEGGTAFLSVDVEPFFPDTAHWRPAPASDATLASILRTQDMSAPERDLFGLLFRDEPGQSRDAEQHMPLDRGYSGRAHVGAAALIAAVHFDQREFHDRLLELLKQSSNQEVRVFLLGSLFGGTGAAGFPTIARSIHGIRKAGQQQQVNGKRIKLGGALMLPYFSFRDPEDPDANVVRHTQLLPQARVALAFYDSLLGEERTFDQLYIAGWDSFFDLPYHEPGKAAQKNPPLLPELLGALAAVEFFMADQIGTEADAPLGPLASSRSQGGQGPVGWADLPVDRLDRKLVYHRLAQLMRFAYWWRYRVEPAFDNREDGLRKLLSKLGVGRNDVQVGHIKLPWLRTLAKGTNWQQGTPEARQHLVQFAEKLKEWAAAMELFAAEQNVAFDLWDLSHLCEERNPQEPQRPVSLRSELDDTQTEPGFSRIVTDLDPVDSARTAADLFAELHEAGQALPANGSEGLGRVVWAVHRAARPFQETR
ncbi:MAG: hypothetical protein SNJ79_13545, partial [Sphingomonadaceae bacterium]